MYDLDWSSSGQIVTVGGDDSIRIFRQAAGSCHKCLALRAYRYVSVVVNISLVEEPQEPEFFDSAEPECIPVPVAEEDLYPDPT